VRTNPAQRIVSGDSRSGPEESQKIENKKTRRKGLRKKLIAHGS